MLGDEAPARVGTLHGTDVTQHPSLHASTAFALAVCDGLTAPSTFLRDEAVARFGLAAERIHVISNFVDLARFTPPDARRIRLAPGKRVLLDLGRLQVPAVGSVVVDATGPVVVSRESSAIPGISVSSAIPDLGRASSP